MDNVININSFDELYNWFLKNYKKIDYVWVNAKRGKPNNKDFSYYDAVYCALCFGFIDSTCKNIDGKTYQKLVPRSKKTHWTYLNIIRCKYLNNKKLIKKEVLDKIPKYDPIKDNIDIINILKEDKKVWNNFNKFPDLYKKIRIDNIAWVRKDKNLFKSRLDKLIKTSKENKMYGQWNDYGRLLEGDVLNEYNY